jgi:hypothetical protein
MELNHDRFDVDVDAACNLPVLDGVCAHKELAQRDTVSSVAKGQMAFIC